MSEDRLLIQKEILDAPRPTATYEKLTEDGINKLVSVNMDGILKAQDAKSVKLERQAIHKDLVALLLDMANPYDLMQRLEEYTANMLKPIGDNEGWVQKKPPKTGSRGLPPDWSGRILKGG